MKTIPENQTFRLLSAVGILLVVLSHMSWGLLDVGGLLNAYQFHVPLFFFIAGYFYRPEAEAAPLAFLKRKALKLLAPYLLWNVLYGVLAQLVRQTTGITFGSGLSFYTLLVQPFVDGHQFLYNLAGWFVPALFLAEAAYLLLRKALRKTPLAREGWFLLLCLALGCGAVWLTRDRILSGWPLPVARTLFFLPCLQLGRFYRTHLERRDTLRSRWYFALVLGGQALFLALAPSPILDTLWFRFPGGAAAAYLGIVLGIAFWLRVCRLLAPVLGRSSAVLYLGRHTYDVMLHHVMALFLVKGLFFAGWRLGLCPGFDAAAFATEFWYWYVPGPWAYVLYLAAAILLPLALRWGQDRVWRRLRARGRAS